MIWRRPDPKQDNFPVFHHQEARIAALEHDFITLSKLLLSYIECDMACTWMGAAKELSETLQDIIQRRESK